MTDELVIALFNCLKTIIREVYPYLQEFEESFSVESNLIKITIIAGDSRIFRNIHDYMNFSKERLEPLANRELRNCDYYQELDVRTLEILPPALLHNRKVAFRFIFEII